MLVVNFPPSKSLLNFCADGENIDCLQGALGVWIVIVIFLSDFKRKPYIFGSDLI